MSTIEGLVIIVAIICVTIIICSFIDRNKPNKWVDGSDVKFMPKR